MKERPKNKRVLFDIGIAGPLAGLVVAIPVLLYGLSLSELAPLTGTGMLEGNSILYLLSKYVVFGNGFRSQLAIRAYRLFFIGCVIFSHLFHPPWAVWMSKYIMSPGQDGQAYSSPRST
jgi:hypothetical protein